MESDAIGTALLKVIERGTDLAAEIRAADYTAAYHKQVNAEIAALNATQNAAGKLAIWRTLQARGFVGAAVKELS